LLPKLHKLQIAKYFFKKPYGHSASTLLQGLIYAELARGDAGVATMCIVQFGLLGNTIETLGS
jgi:alkylation response protein AidB-like acyl-CoA dehydrogenase